MTSIKPSATANEIASAIANTINLKSDQLAGLALVIQAGLEQYEWDRALLLGSLCAGTARWEHWANRSKGEICVDGLRYPTDVDGGGCPELNPLIRRALVKAKQKTSVPK